MTTRVLTAEKRRAIGRNNGPKTTGPGTDAGPLVTRGNSARPDLRRRSPAALRNATCRPGRPGSQPRRPRPALEPAPDFTKRTCARIRSRRGARNYLRGQPAHIRFKKRVATLARAASAGRSGVAAEAPGTGAGTCPQLYQTNRHAP